MNAILGLAIFAGALIVVPLAVIIVYGVYNATKKK